MAREAIHPGEFLADELAETGITASGLARRIGVPGIVHGKRNITAGPALGLGRFFGTGAEIWMNPQKAYDLDKARIEFGSQIEDIPHWQQEKARA